MKKKKKSLYKMIRDLGFDTKFSKKVSQRKDGLFEKVQLEEMLDKYKGDASLVKKIFEGENTFNKREISKFINAERRERKFFKGKFSGELTKKEKDILFEKMQTGGLKEVNKLLKNRIIDKESRLEEFKNVIGRGKKPPKQMIKEIKRINKIMGASPNGQPGLFVLREMYINGLTEREAIDLIKERQSPVDKDTVFYS